MNPLQSVIPQSPTDNFTAEKWRQLVAPLSLRESELGEVAARHGLKLLGNSRWPELRLRRASGCTVGEVRVSLAPESLQQEQLRWAVRVVTFPRILLFKSHRSSVRDVAVLEESDLSRGNVLADSVRAGIALLDDLLTGRVAGGKGQ